MTLLVIYIDCCNGTYKNIYIFSLQHQEVYTAGVQE